ncbi:MAG TPA: cysteine peptidase family C39 domain-containing protein, partial [Xanthobacteraceae bacterium]|nr:cysteine peptidase family C39 domain-containing protein [Xanthobacteraceae bacterium]
MMAGGAVNLQARAPDAAVAVEPTEPAPAEQRVSDPLTDALVYLAARHGRALSREALLAGLPITEGRLTVKLLPRAAERAGLEAEAVRRDLADIPALVLPALLIMKDGTTRILVEIDRATRKARVVNPTKTDERADTPEPEYSGYAFLVRPMAEADPRAVAAGDLPRSHWFWSVVRKFWANYSHVAVAALVVNLLALAAPLFVMNVYDRVIPNGAIPSLIALAFGLGIAIAFDFFLRVVRSQIIDMT